MLDYTDHRAVLTWGHDEIAALPRAGDETYEYKSSLTPDDKLAEKIGRAASGFWNSGGGVFVAGVNGEGRPDGGLAMTVGRISRRDWIDQAVGRVSPRASYTVRSIEGGEAQAGINAGRAVYVVAFAESSVGPHMAPDDRYYIRTGAHTVPAKSFIVDALYARRRLTRPLLRSIARRKPGNDGVIQLGVVALTDAPGLDVEVSVEPLPRLLERASDRFPLRVPVVNAQLPFFIDFHLRFFGEQELPKPIVALRYKDVAAREYEERFELDIERQIGPIRMGGTDAEEVARKLDDIEKGVRAISPAIGKNEQHLAAIARKLK